MNPPRFLASLSVYRRYRLALLVALALYALLAIRAATVMPYARLALANYGHFGAAAYWFVLPALVAVAAGALGTGVLVWRHREVERVRWWLLGLALVAWTGFAVCYGFAFPAEGYPSVRILLTAALGVAGAVPLALALGKVPVRSEEAGGSGGSYELQPLRSLTGGAVAVLLGIAVWGVGGPGPAAGRGDLGDLEFTGAYEPVGNPCLLADLRPVLDRLELAPSVESSNSAYDADEGGEGYFYALCSIVPEQWDAEFDLSAATDGDFAVEEHPGIYLFQFELRFEEAADPGLLEGCETAAMDDGTTYRACTEPAEADGSGPTTFATGMAVENLQLTCRFAEFQTPGRESLIAATEEVCADILVRLHEEHRR